MDGPSASGATKKDRFDQVEQITRMLSLIVVPVLLAFIGWFVQNALQQQTLALQKQTLMLQAASDQQKASSDYIGIAVAILQKPKSGKKDDPLRPWAVNLLDAYSPVKIDPFLTTCLKTGEATLPPISLGITNEKPSYLVQMFVPGSRNGIDYEFLPDKNAKGGFRLQPVPNPKSKR